MIVPTRDIIFGQIIRWLAENGLEMHTNRRGETYVCERLVKRQRPEKEPTHDA